MHIRITIVLIFVLAIMATRISAQDLMPLFGEPTRVWTSKMWGSPFGACLDTYTTSHWIDGDTVINGLIYYRLRSHTLHDISSIVIFCEGSSHYAEPTIFVREIDGRVYVFDQDQGLLFYDFTASVGDSIPNSPYGINPSMIVVIMVDSIFINGTYRKRQWVEADPGTDPIFVIEGIGSSSGLFKPFTYQLGLSHFIELTCVREQDEVIFGEASCMLVNDIFENNIFPIIIHPNPTTGIINFSDQLTYEIFDATGRFITSGRATTADLTAEPSGLYLIRVSDDTMRSYHRVVLEH
jgi:hypothetical protein